MLQYIIRGGSPLHGVIALQGAKNSVLPILAASVLCTRGAVTLENCPALKDVSLSVRILRALGCTVEETSGGLRVNAQAADRFEISRTDCGGMRSSVLFLGPMLARCGKAELYMPGGCLLGKRPVDIHISALAQMGAVFQVSHEKIIAAAPYGLAGCEIKLPYPSVGATENIIMAASLSEGVTTIQNAAIEPEICDLADFIVRMGGRVEIRGQRIKIEGVQALSGCQKRVIPDRIAAFTYLAAALATDGAVTVTGCLPEQMESALAFLSAVGGRITVEGDQITAVRAGRELFSVPQTVTGPYPAFPTDAGSIALVLLSLANGESLLRETVFSDRFCVTEQLTKLGADICVNGRDARVRGVSSLVGGSVEATDLRAGAALIVAGLCAHGQTVVGSGEHIIRGYQDIAATLRALGADIEERTV